MTFLTATINRKRIAYYPTTEFWVQCAKGPTGLYVTRFCIIGNVELAVAKLNGLVLSPGDKARLIMPHAANRLIARVVRPR